MTSPTSAPRLLRLLAQALVPRRDQEFIIGDLEEAYVRDLARAGRWVAGARYLRNVLASAGGRLSSTFSADLGHVSRTSGAGSLGVAILSDLHHALRSLRRESGFAVLAVLTLAVGIGSSATVFAMADQLLLRPLPGVHDDGDGAYLRFQRLGDSPDAWGQPLTTLGFDEIRSSATFLDGLASYGWVPLNASAARGRPIKVRGMWTYGDFFETLGVRPTVGRLFTAKETEVGSGSTAVVISATLAGRILGSSSAAVGRTIYLNGKARTVIGVAGEGFVGPERGGTVDLWLPLGSLPGILGVPAAALRDSKSPMHGSLVLRFRRGISVQVAEAQLSSAFERLPEARDSTGGASRVRPVLYPGFETTPAMRATTTATLRMFAEVVALVLILACANVANLLLVRNVTRRSAVATRRALGASSGRIAREHLAQSLVLGVLGTSVGLVVGWLISLSFRGESLMGMPVFQGLALDDRVVLFAGVAAIVTTVLFGTLPSVFASRFDPASAIRAAGRQTSRSAVFRAVLSAAQLGLSLTLMVGALLLVRSVHNLYTLDTGLDIDGVASLSLQHSRGLGAAETMSLYERVVAAVQSVPGVQKAALGTFGPEGPMFQGHARGVDPHGVEAIKAAMIPVTPGWFEVFRVRTVQGRTFHDGEWGLGAPAEVVLTESLARKIFGASDVVGRTVSVGAETSKEMTVTGVVDNIRSSRVPDRPQDAFFIPYGSLPLLNSFGFFTVYIRSQHFDARVAAAIRESVEQALPDQPVPEPVLAVDQIGQIHSERRILRHLLALLSVLAACLASVGLYGVTAFVVAGRRREFGIRLTLGAKPTGIGALVLQYGATILGAGTVLGLLGAFCLSVILRGRLFGVHPLDLASYATATVLLGLVAAAACWIPARRAMRVDPAATLREE